MKLQSALEYLMTYGWAILITSIALSALFALGVFNPSKFAGQECAISSGLSCLNYYLNQNGVLELNLVQSTSGAINVTALGCANTKTTAYMQAPYNPPSNQVYMPLGSNYTFAIQCYANGTAFSAPVGTLFSGYLVINYTDISTGFPNTVYGRIIVKVG